MDVVDQNIIKISDSICKNSASMADVDRGFVSQNILMCLQTNMEFRF